MKNNISKIFDKVLSKLRLAKYKDIILFIIILLFLHFSFNGLNRMINRINPHAVNPIEEKLKVWSFVGSGYVLDMLGYEFATCKDNDFLSAQYEKGIDYERIDCTSYYFKHSDTVLHIVNACSGFKQMMVTLFLLLLFPGPWRDKLWFIPLAVVLMFITNILRITALGIVLVEAPNYWDFFHINIFKPGYYIVLFMIWVWWNEQFYRKTAKAKK